MVSLIDERFFHAAVVPLLPESVFPSEASFEIYQRDVLLPAINGLEGCCKLTCVHYGFNGIIDRILGKPDAQLMKEALTVDLDERHAEDDELQALNDPEMVRSITKWYDTDLTKLGIWQPLHNLLLASTMSDALRMPTLWIIGTALQNNPAAQLAYLDVDPLPTLLKYSPLSNSAETRSRGLYALYGPLKLNSAAAQKMSVVDGWSALRMCLEVNLQPNISLPTSEDAPPPIHVNSHASMLSDPASVSTSALTVAAIQEEGEQGGSLLDALISALIEPVPFGVDGEIDKDDEFQENIVR
ncbi:Fes1-domain-containing protein [Suillus variegatus]|nr:Fes1-domain-containing protein [Suillus variegatus]